MAGNAKTDYSKMTVDEVEKNIQSLINKHSSIVENNLGKMLVNLNKSLIARNNGESDIKLNDKTDPDKHVEQLINFALNPDVKFQFNFESIAEELNEELKQLISNLDAANNAQGVKKAKSFLESGVNKAIEEKRASLENKLSTNEGLQQFTTTHVLKLNMMYIDTFNLPIEQRNTLVNTLSNNTDITYDTAKLAMYVKNPETIITKIIKTYSEEIKSQSGISEESITKIQNSIKQEWQNQLPKSAILETSLNSIIGADEKGRNPQRELDDRQQITEHVSAALKKLDPEYLKQNVTTISKEITESLLQEQTYFSSAWSAITSLIGGVSTFYISIASLEKISAQLIKNHIAGSANELEHISNNIPAPDNGSPETQAKSQIISEKESSEPPKPDPLVNELKTRIGAANKPQDTKISDDELEIIANEPMPTIDKTSSNNPKNQEAPKAPNTEFEHISNDIPSVDNGAPEQKDNLSAKLLKSVKNISKTISSSDNSKNKKSNKYQELTDDKETATKKNAKRKNTTMKDAKENPPSRKSQSAKMR